MRKKLLIVSILIISIVMFGNKVSNAMSYYENVSFRTGIVTASALNVRSGPSTSFKSIGLVYKNEYVRVFAKIGDFYVIQTNNDLVGMASTNYIRNATVTNNQTSNNTTTQNTNTSSDNLSGYSSAEQELLNLINKQRANYGLSALKFDAELQRVAKAKALDLVQNNYFAHESPVYGTPFEMMKSFGITYKTAGENIAGNSSLQGAVTAWMNSSGHRANILNSAYNYTGIGVVDSPKYGMIMVQMFIGR